MTGIIAVCCHELSRFSEFSSCLANLRKPEGAIVQVQRGMHTAINRRDVVRMALERNAEWVFFVDDDMLFAPDHLERLLAHNLPVVASLYFNRKPAFYPMAFNDRRHDNGKTEWGAVSLQGAPQKGLVEVVAAGTGGMLIKTGVFRAIEYDTWFLHDEGTEDLPFCDRIIFEAGCQIYVDLEAIMGHISTYSVWPTYTGDTWKAGIALTEEHLLLVEVGS